MSISFSRSPPQSPSASSATPRRSPFMGQHHRRSSTQDSFASFSSSTIGGGNETLLNKSSYDGYRGSSSREVPTSPTGSTATSNGGQSPTSFHSFTHASTSTVRVGSYAGADEGDDLGDRTFMMQDETPRKVEYSGKGKQREVEQNASETTLRQPFTDAQAENGQSGGYDDPEEEEEDDSARIEETLRAWAKKEKLRRAKTRSRQIAPAPQTPAIVSDGITAVSGLARRVSQVRRSNSIGNGRASTRHSQRLASVDPSASHHSPFQDVVEEMELQPSADRSRPPLAPRSHTSPSTASPVRPALTDIRQPQSATSSTFPLLDRIERAAKTGSRFIEDLEDQEMQNSLAITGQQIPSEAHPQSYAQLQSNPSSPLASPSKPRSKLRINIGRPANDDRTHSFASVAGSFASIGGKGESSEPFASRHGSRTVTPRGSVTSLKSPTGSTLPPHLYYDGANASKSNLVVTPRESRDFDGPFGDRYESRRREDSAEDASFLERARKIGWLEYFFCCGCFGAGISLEDDDAQAGRTFPE